jgi:hypothetical protein
MHRHAVRRYRVDYIYRTTFLLSLLSFLASYIGSEVFFVGTAWFAIEPKIVSLAMIASILGLVVTALGIMFERLENLVPPRFIRRTQIMIGAMIVTGSIGPIVGFTFGDFAWKVAYQTIVPVIMVMIVITYFLVRESAARERNIHIHYSGALLLGIFIAVMIYALIMGKNWVDLKPPPQILQLSSLVPLSYYIAMTAAIIFTILNLTHPHSQIRFIFFRQRNVVSAFILNTISAITSLLITWVLIIMYEAPPPYGYGYNNFEVGMAFLPRGILFFTGVAISLLFINRLGAKRTIYIGAMTTIFGASILIFVVQPASAVISFSAIAEAGAGILLVAADRMIKKDVSGKVLPTANATKTTFHCIGAMLGCLIGDAITITFIVWQPDGIFNGVPIFKAVPAPEAYAIAFAVVVILNIMALILGFLAKALTKDVILHSKIKNLQFTKNNI